MRKLKKERYDNKLEIGDWVKTDTGLRGEIVGLGTIGNKVPAYKINYGGNRITAIPQDQCSLWFKKDEEYNRLLKVRIYPEGDNQFRLAPATTKQGVPLQGKGTLRFRGSKEQFAKFLQKIQAKDAQTDPPSSKNRTYMQMVNTAIDKSDPYIWIWNKNWYKANKIIMAPKKEKGMKKVKTGDIVTLAKDVRLPNTKIILERGDKIQITKKESYDEPDYDNDAFIQSNGFRYSVSASGEFIGEYTDIYDAEEALKDWMEGNKFWPSVWFVSDHGNVSVHMMEKAQESSVFDKHQLKIAKDTLKMSDIGANVMGGMTKDQARDFLRKMGWTDRQIAALEEAKIKEVDVSKIIKDLQNNFSGSNEDQMKGVQLLKGLATSDDPKSNEFMQKLDQATTKISQEVIGKQEAFDKSKKVPVYDTDRKTILAYVSQQATSVGAAKAAGARSASQETVDGILSWIIKEESVKEKERVRVAIKKYTYKGKDGWLLTGFDKKGDKVNSFVPGSKEDAEKVRDYIKGGYYSKGDVPTSTSIK
jgi:hypothetical protein